MARAFACSVILAAFSLLPVVPATASSAASAITDPRGNPVDPWQSGGSLRVFLFVRADCPITNRYAPELKRIAQRYKDSPVSFWLVYSGQSETAAAVEKHRSEYDFPGTPLLDRGHLLVRRAKATVSPEVAVFDRTGHLLYHGRIDDRWISFGKSRPEPTVHDLDQVIRSALAGQIPTQRASEAIGCSLEDAR